MAIKKLSTDQIQDREAETEETVAPAAQAAATDTDEL